MAEGDGEEAARPALISLAEYRATRESRASPVLSTALWDRAARRLDRSRSLLNTAREPLLDTLELIGAAMLESGQPVDLGVALASVLGDGSLLGPRFEQRAAQRRESILRALARRSR